jgi:hypothetical protein
MCQFVLANKSVSLTRRVTFSSLTMVRSVWPVISVLLDMEPKILLAFYSKEKFSELNSNDVSKFLQFIGITVLFVDIVLVSRME